MKQPMNVALFADCETDLERAAFIRIRGFATGIVAQSCVEEIASAFDQRAVVNASYRNTVRAEILEYEDKIARLMDALRQIEGMTKFSPFGWHNAVASKALYVENEK